MKGNLYKQDTRMFFNAALESQRGQLLTEMADAVCECRAAANQKTELSQNGRTGLLRLIEVWCAMDGVSEVMFSEGRLAELLANVVAQVYAHLILHPFHDPEGLALYVELRAMAAALMMGEWFE